MAMAIKHLSSVANDVVRTTASQFGCSVEELVGDFEGCYWNDDDNMKKGQEYNDEGNYENYSRKLVEYCCTKAVKEICENIEEKIGNGSFSRFTFDVMLAWQIPTSAQEEYRTENMAKGREDKKKSQETNLEDEDIPLFYSDIMPLLVNDEPSVGEDAYVWLGSLVPLVADVVNARFTFETLTAPTNNRLHFPAYDKLLREVDKTIKHLEKQATPRGVELRENEFVLHVEGTASSQRVVRHIGGTSWPGRLTLTNYALYFEASGVITYEDALKINLSNDIGQSIKPAATGPWGAPLFDKAIVYDSPDLPEGIVLEFPEMTSSTRRDHWLALTKEILLLHKFLSTFDITSPVQVWETHARTILGVVRLHAAREMLRISPPDPTKFLIFALYDEIPKGDFVLEKLAESVKQASSGNSCSASSVLRSMTLKKAIISDGDDNDKGEIVEDVSSLETAIFEAREVEKEIAVAKATTEELKEEGLTDSAIVLIGLLKPLKSGFDWFQGIVTWEKPTTTLTVIVTALIVTYREWVGIGISVLLCWVVAMMFCARHKKIGDECREILVNSASDQSTLESVVSAQHGLRTVYEIVQTANISILKLRSIFISKARKHANMVMIVMVGLAVILAVIPIKYIIMATILYFFTMTSKLGQSFGSGQGNRRLKEWWDSIPVIHVRLVDQPCQF